ncbi:germination protein YpeB [Paratissierella segnis]|jgi:spore germination protein|uniref:Germination protein YpeB n=1 Tax=Paratissierella segnis TaxID=2763679 RepID=A0A926ERT7_9FIRM|nr:germination protein YpeB [Paratissierella segnis]MBC8588573.1 germination protein YpeB [Paratissierella segnis]
MDNKRRHWIAPTVLSLLLIVALIWGYNQNIQKKQLQTSLENHYQRLFYDIKKHTENVQVSLSKALLATTKERNVMNFTQIVSEANSAQDKLNQLPIQHADNNKISKFLTQASDYANYLIDRHLAGEDITDEQREALRGLQMNSATFNGELANLHQSLMESNFMVGMGQGIDEANENVLSTSLVSLDKQIGKSPELIYDGPFSDQILNKKPVGLSGSQVDINQAQQAAVDFFGRNRVAGIEAFEQGENADDLRIPSYTFNLYPSNQQKDFAVYMGVAKQGGTVLWMENPRPAVNKTLTVEQGQEKALEYLRNKGFGSMEPNYSLQYDGIVLYNFVYKQDDVTIYPDLVKVKVALDNGEIVGFDASPYYLNHQERNFGRPEIDVDTARERVKTDFDIDSVRLSLIPKGVNEILCYEFKGKYGDADFIVYINAKNGAEEQILQLIQNENGTLTF